MKITKIAYYSFLALMISVVVVPKLSPIFIILLTLVWFSERCFAEKAKVLLKTPYLLILPFLFALFTLGLINSDDLSYGFEKLETRLSLLLLPIILPTLKSLNFAYKKRVFAKWFVYANIAVAIFCLLRAFVYYFYELCFLQNSTLEETDISANHFYYSALSDGIMHPGYLAMYVNTALILVLFDIRKTLSRNTKIRRIIQASFLVLFIVLLYSKAGVLCMLIVLFAYGVRLAILQKEWWMLPTTAFGLILLLLGMYFFVPNTKYRLNGVMQSFQIDRLDPLSTESTQTRLHAWKASEVLIAEQPCFGHGTGDAMHVLRGKYLELGYIGAHTKDMNAHNEYFQTGIALGFLGIFTLMALFFWGFVVTISRRNFALGIWLLCSALVIYFESYLNTQAGVLFFAIFAPFLTLLKNGESTS